MFRPEEQAQTLCRTLAAQDKNVNEILSSLEVEFGDNFTQLYRGSRLVIAWVYDDSRPIRELYTFPIWEKAKKSC